MPFPALRPALLFSSLLCLGMAASWPAAAIQQWPRQALPALPEAAPAPGRFTADPDQVAIGYDTRREKWGVTMEEYIGLEPSFTARYGTLLNNRVGAGARLSRRQGLSEILINGVMAPTRDLRLRLTAGQLQATGDALPVADAALNTVQQNSYLVQLRKIWDDDRFLSSFGLAAYTVDASGSGDAAGWEADPMESAGGVALGRLSGYSLNLSLRPTPSSRLELRHGQDMLAYRYHGALLKEEGVATSLLKYTHDLGSCTRFSGNFSTSDDIDRLDLKMTKDRWSFGFSRALGTDARDTTIQLGFSIPLGRDGATQACDSSLPAPPAFTPMAEIATTRPDQFPGDALAIGN